MLRGGGGAPTENLFILGKIYLFAYYGRAFHYLQLEIKLSLYDKNYAHGMQFYVRVYRMTQQKLAEQC